MTMKGVGRRIAYAAVQTELRQTLQSIKRGTREQRRGLTDETRRMTWFDWLQEQAANGREDALLALRATAVGRDRNKAKTLSAHKNAPAPALPALEPKAQVTKQGTVIDKVSGHEIRDNGQGRQSGLKWADPAQEKALFARQKT